MNGRWRRRPDRRAARAGCRGSSSGGRAGGHPVERPGADPRPPGRPSGWARTSSRRRPIRPRSQRCSARVGPDQLPLGEVLQDQRSVCRGSGTCGCRRRCGPSRRVAARAARRRVATDDEILDALGVGPDGDACRGPRSVPGTVPLPACRGVLAGVAHPRLLRSRGQGDDNRTAYWCPRCQRGPTVAS